MTIAATLERVCSHKVHRETVLLTLIAMADLASTVVLIKLGLAMEANPILSWYLGRGIGMFVAAKTFLSFAPVAGLEMLGWQYPVLARFGLRAGIAGYLAIYVFGSLKIHGWI